MRPERASFSSGENAQMKTHTLNILLLCLSLNPMLSAQEKVPMAPSRILIDTKMLRRPQSTPKDASANLTSLTVSDAFANIVVQPGQTLPLVSVADWTGADHVSIAIECPASTSLQNSSIAVAWGVPLSNAPNYTVTDLILGKSFFLPNMGGAVVPVYGNQLGLIIVNAGTTTLTCDQVTVYGVVH
jgi:hypothetical protein